MPGLETYTQQDLDRLVQMLSSPDGERELMGWVKDWVARTFAVTDAQQILGAPNLLFHFATSIPNADSTSSASFVDLATRGPELTGMADGNWLIFWGCVVAVTVADSTAQMGMQPSWAGISDTHVASASTATGATKGAVYARHFGVQGAPAARDATGQGNNSIRAMYKRGGGAGTCTFSNRWLCAIRTGPPVES